MISASRPAVIEVTEELLKLSEKASLFGRIVSVDVYVMATLEIIGP